MKLAIISCQHLPKGVTEDQPLFEALTQHQYIEYKICVWDDARIDWSQFDACLLRSVWDYHEKSAEFFQWIQQTSEVTKIINPPQAVLWNSNKFYLKELQQAGLSIAPTLWLSQHEKHDLSAAVKKLPCSTRYFLKPIIGADSSGTFRFHGDQIQQAQTHLDDWLKQHSMMLQCYLPSVESYGEVSAIYFGGQLSHAIRKIPVKGDYRVQDTFGAKDITHQLNETELKTADAANDYISKQFANLCYARVDLLADGHNVYINEIELIEPSLFFHYDSKATSKLVKVLLSQNS